MSGAVFHGSVSEQERAALAARGIVVTDLSASLNPYGPLDVVVQAAAQAVVARYPEADAWAVRAAYAERSGLPVAFVLTGNGSSELIYLALRAFSGPDASCLVIGPTFGEYAAAARAAGARVVEWRVPDALLAPSVDALRTAIENVRPAVVCVCNPNNPTGLLFTRAEVELLTAAARAAGALLLLDEAYGEFTWPADERVLPAPGRLVLRTLTTLHTVPGLRIGFLLGEGGDIARVAALQPPWAVSAPACAAALAALREEAWEDECRQRIAATREALIADLHAAGVRLGPSRANALLLYVGDGAAFRARLLEAGFAVRDCASFGLPEYVRIAVPREEQCAALIAGVRAAFRS